MSKTWKIAPRQSEDLLEQLLFNRGFKTKEEKENFLDPKLSDYEDELNLVGINVAKKRILQAIEKKELIIVYGDYDVDGVCGAAVLYYGLTLLGAKVLPYIPHREKEGYGLSELGLQNAKDKGATLVITVDHGIVALEQAKFAKSLGLDLIITDHHVPLENKPEALAIVHSTKICGAAVGWCLIRSLLSKEDSLDLLDLVAMATVADMVPLIGINRSLVKSGLEVLKHTRKLGIKALAQASKVRLSEVSTYHIGHILAPRLNAIGRLENAIDALRLLCTKDPLKASQLAQLLCETNDQKKKLTADAILEAKEIINTEIKLKGQNKILVLHSHTWIPGIIGLIAGRISDEYNLPTIVISKGEVQSKGSARSANGLDIVELIRSTSDILVDVGGHPKAAGFTIETGNIDLFKSRLEKALEKAEVGSSESLEIEAEIKTKIINKKLFQDILKLEPTGVENPKPILASLQVKISELKALSEGQHLKFKADGIDAIAFSFGKLKNLLQDGQLVNLAYCLELNEFNGRETLQLRILDITF